MSDELESEILSYREFKKREALLAWEQRRRAFHARAGGWDSDREITSAGLRPRERHWTETGGSRR